MMKQKQEEKYPQENSNWKACCVSNNCFRHSEKMPLLCSFAAAADEACCPALHAEQNTQKKNFQEIFTFGEVNFILDPGTHDSNVHKIVQDSSAEQWASSASFQMVSQQNA